MNLPTKGQRLLVETYANVGQSLPCIVWHDASCPAFIPRLRAIVSLGNANDDTNKEPWDGMSYQQLLQSFNLFSMRMMMLWDLATKTREFWAGCLCRCSNAVEQRLDLRNVTEQFSTYFEWTKIVLSDLRLDFKSLEVNVSSLWKDVQSSFKCAVLKTENSLSLAPSSWQSYWASEQSWRPRSQTSSIAAFSRRRPSQCPASRLFMFFYMFHFRFWPLHRQQLKQLLSWWR